MECYICTEPTTEKSPCECQAAVHIKCLEKFVNETNKPECTICRKPLKVEIESPNRALQFAKFFFFLLCGYFGRCILSLAIDKDFLSEGYFWMPVELDFFILATCVYMICIYFLKAVTYLRCCYIQQYDSFDSDSDNEYDSELV